MCAQPAYRPRAKQAIKGDPRRASGSIRKMAVLFTDVVGSSAYFKKYGDLAGREMLRKHQELASQPVTEHGGAVVKILGDSVMAYFTDPGEALKAAVRIQQRFARNNRDKDAKGRIRVRIGLHYGDGIVENGDIYGDVVNITAKFLPLVQGDEIFISGQLHEQVQGLSWARFERLDLKVTKDILKALSIYRVCWDDKARLDPSLSSILVLKPAWNLARNDFQKTWALLLQRKSGLWPRTPGQHITLEDGTLALFLKDPSEAPVIARNALRFLRENLGSDGMPFLPIQILIDTGQFRRAGEPALESLKPVWSRARPGDICVSRRAFEAMEVPDGFTAVPPEAEGDQGLFRLIPEGTSPGESSCLFLYQHSMGQGSHDPCFYCGDRRHLPSDCPSKQLPDLTHGLERLGYLSLERINEVYFSFLNQGTGTPTPDAEEDLAQQAFFELRKVVQLRFLRVLWASRAEEWDKLQEERNEDEKGGLLWIGQDCIRVSNLVQAETLLARSLEGSPGDFLALCAMGFVQVERGDLLRAKRFFKHALEHAESVPRQIFTRFLLARVHELKGEQRHAENHVRKILLSDSQCAEALYQHLKDKFGSGRHGEGLRLLRKLVESNRLYFIASLIDPDLAKHSEKIHAELRKMLERARADSVRMTAQAEEEVERMRRVMGEDEGDLKRATAYLEKIRELSSTESYFGYLDILYYATVTVQIGQRSGEQMRRKLLRITTSLRRRRELAEGFVRGYPHGSLLGSLPEELRSLAKQIDAVQDVLGKQLMERYREALGLARQLSDAMDRLEQRMRRLEAVGRWIRFAVGFTKKAFLMEGAIVVISLLLFPVIGHYLSFLIPGLDFSPENVWVYQKGVLIIGGLLGLFLAFVMSARDLGGP